MGFNSAFKGLTLILLTWTKWWAPASASKWRMGFNSAFKGLITNTKVRQKLKKMAFIWVLGVIRLYMYGGVGADG
jgi:hypothetical protein